ncbi:MAG TPA: type I methionyl aminopeptidase [Dissulfurispiraceae bacterium]|nr:type I methionyl aminopeptidase [Dissulfurispiraceae bacterium]
MVILKSQAEIKKIGDACHIVAEILTGLKSHVAAGMSTADIESFVDAEIKKRKGAVAAFRGYRGYPSSVCVSVNDQVIHGIPSRSAKLKSGDIVGVDLGIVLDGFYGDAAVTIPVGVISPEAARLMEATEKALSMGIEQAVPGKRIGDIGAAIQQHVEENGYSVVRAFVGHGVGRSLHEDPQVPNFGRGGQGIRIKEGMTLAIEPMVNAGGHDVRILDDGWTAVTSDGSLSAHFEHTIAVTRQGPKILTKY